VHGEPRGPHRAARNAQEVRQPLQAGHLLSGAYRLHGQR
jgi:hypothetical protein